MYSQQAITVFCLLVVGSGIADGKPRTMDPAMLESMGIDPNSVLEHEIVEISLPEEKLHKRDVTAETPLKIHSLGMDFKLLLRAPDAVLAPEDIPVYYAISTPGKNGGVSYEKVPDAMKPVRRILTDPKHDVTVLIDPSGKVAVNGKLRNEKTKETLVIRNVPKPLGGTIGNKSPHLVAKLKDPLPQKRISRGVPKTVSKTVMKTGPNTVGKTVQKPAGSVKPASKKIANILYPQILVEIDHTFLPDLKAHGMPAFLGYFMAVMYGVDMVYRDLNNPKIRFNIAAIVIAKDALATPFIENNRGEPDAFDYVAAINHSAHFHFGIEKSFPFNSWDLITTFTKLKMGKNGNYGTAGIAYREGICTVLPRQSRVDSVSIVQDNFGFAGILSAAHEIGHLLGFHHDDTDEKEGCTVETGYIMTHTSVISPHASWASKCSRDTLKRRLADGAYECLYNEPSKKAKLLPNVIPAKMVSLEEQCKALGRGPPCFLDEKDVCVELWCQNLDNPRRCHTEMSGAAPGTPCGQPNDPKPKFCFKSRCVEAEKGF